MTTYQETIVKMLGTGGRTFDGIDVGNQDLFNMMYSRCMINRFKLHRVIESSEEKVSDSMTNRARSLRESFVWIETNCGTFVDPSGPELITWFKTLQSTAAALHRLSVDPAPLHEKAARLARALRLGKVQNESFLNLRSQEFVEQCSQLGFFSELAIDHDTRMFLDVEDLAFQLCAEARNRNQQEFNTVAGEMSRDPMKRNGLYFFFTPPRDRLSNPEKSKLPNSVYGTDAWNRVVQLRDIATKVQSKDGVRRPKPKYLTDFRLAMFVTDFGSIVGLPHSWIDLVHSHVLVRKREDMAHRPARVNVPEFGAEIWKNFLKERRVPLPRVMAEAFAALIAENTRGRGSVIVARQLQRFEREEEFQSPVSEAARDVRSSETIASSENIVFEPTEGGVIIILAAVGLLFLLVSKAN